MLGRAEPLSPPVLRVGLDTEGNLTVTQIRVQGRTFYFLLYLWILLRSRPIS